MLFKNSNWLSLILNSIYSSHTELLFHRLSCILSVWHMQDHYLCATLRECALLGRAVAPNEMLQKRHLQRIIKRSNATLFWFDIREHKGEVKKIKWIERIKMQPVWERPWGSLQREGRKRRRPGGVFQNKWRKGRRLEKSSHLKSRETPQLYL